MPIPIYENDNFVIETPNTVFVSREEGGHIRLRCKHIEYHDRTMLPASLAIEFMKLSMIAGEALQKVMNDQGITVIKINYHDMGNWAYKEGKKPYIHYHIFGRVLGAKHQPFPEAVYLPDKKSGFYNGFISINDEDIALMQKEIGELLSSEKYRNF